MSSHNFVIEVKSTLDKVVHDLALSLDNGTGIAVYDMDDAVNVDDILTSSEPAVLWRFLNLDEAPTDPLYMVEIVVGVKTTSDPSNYELLSYISAIKGVFKVGGNVDVYDYSKEVQSTDKTGYLLYTQSGIEPQGMDRASGLRMLAVTAAAVRLI